MCFGQLTTGTFGPVVVAAIGSPAEAVVSERDCTGRGLPRRSPSAARYEREQREVRARAGGGRKLRDGGRAVDVVAGGDAHRRGAGDGGGAAIDPERCGTVAAELMLAPLCGTEGGGRLSLEALGGLQDVIEEKKIRWWRWGRGFRHAARRVRLRASWWRR